jgi:hypothetical protein
VPYQMPKPHHMHQESALIAAKQPIPARARQLQSAVQHAGRNQQQLGSCTSASANC